MEPPIANGPSARVRIAQIARETALAVPGVADLDAGPDGRFATTGGGVLVPGVTSIIAPEGGYDVTLRLICEMVALHPLGDRVREVIQTTTADAGLAVASVSILVTGIAEPSSV